MIEFITFPKAEDPRQVYFSPFCTKTEVFLKLAGLEYKVTEFNGNPGKFENGKLPVIVHQGQTIADSHFIEEYLNTTFDLDLDSHLSAEDKAKGFMVKKMCEEYLYWAILHERWFIDKNWEDLKEKYFGHIPALIRGFATGLIRKQMRKAADGQGVSRHSDEKVLQLGKEALAMLADTIGTNTFLLGDQVSSYDASVYGTVSSVLHSPIGPELKAATLKHPSIVAYDQTMYQLVFGAGS